VPLVLVTGISGSGKSTVCEELKPRGYEAHDIDLEGNAVWVHRKTGEVTAMPAAPKVGTPQWLAEWEWRVVRHKVEGLAERAGDRTVFLCGITANEKEVWHLFSLVIYLSIDSQTLRRRVASRTTKDFGKAPHELAAILAWHDVGEDQYRQFGAVIIDATRPLHQVVDDVLEASI
jgi:dephospho-CoA kinase